MFISHLNIFLSFFTLFIFVSRLKNQRFYEWMLSLFAFVNFSNALVWSLYLYYHLIPPLFIDNYGVISEIIALVLPIFILIDLRSDRSSKRFKTEVILLLVFTFLAILFQFLLTTSDNFYLFYPFNKNYKYNIYLQLGFDFLITGLFLLLYFRKQTAQQLELFDGNFKRYFGAIFIIYYAQDILMLSMMVGTKMETGFVTFLQNLSMILSLIISIILGIMGIATNYLPLWNKMREFEANQNRLALTNQAQTFIYHKEQWEQILPIDWNKIKAAFIEQYPQIIQMIDEDKNLTKTEKIYVFITNFELSHKEISNLLSVSLRTVETNYYRIKQKKIIQ